MRWVEITDFSSSWSRYATSTEPPAYTKDADGTVHLRGRFGPGTNGGIVFYLPEEFRPVRYGVAATGLAWAYPNAEPAMFLIETNGEVRIYWDSAFTATFVSADGASFNRAITETD